MRALLFPAREYHPKLVDIEYTVAKDPDGTIQHRIDFAPWMTPGARPKSYPITRHNYDGPYLGRSLMMFINDNFYNDQSPLNRTITLMVPDDLCWRDNILVVGAREPLAKYAQYYNATENDIAPTIQYLVGYGKMAREMESQYE
ncbi:hypothetical protein NLI96_g11849 [Meripilus lineatus]|uniref:Uncharacterized protein n=1 Tax=Meripilus lineatus TaxID=2056292 RepID=A0AAD5Y8S0_9APHY|nr:hypothetical protein NLI96_g11849 [Physisporinus lineatus]